MRRAVERWGRPIGVDEARDRWSALLDEAEAGVATLLHCAPRALAVLAPVAELYTPQIGLRAVFSTRARAKLGALVQAADAGLPQLLARRDLVFAALLPAVRDIEVAPGQLLDPDVVVRAGGRISLGYRPKQPMPANQHDGATAAKYWAVAYDGHGLVIGHGESEHDLASAVRELRSPAEEAPLPASLHPSPLVYQDP